MLTVAGMILAAVIFFVDDRSGSDADFAMSSYDGEDSRDFVPEVTPVNQLSGQSAEVIDEVPEEEIDSFYSDDDLIDNTEGFDPTPDSEMTVVEEIESPAATSADVDESEIEGSEG